MVQTYKTKRVSRLLDLTLRTLQLWDDSGLVSPRRVTGNGGGAGRVREYNDSDLVRLRIVKRLRDAGVSIHEVRRSLRGLALHADIAFLAYVKGVYPIKQFKTAAELIDWGKRLTVPFVLVQL